MKKDIAEQQIQQIYKSIETLPSGILQLSTYKLKKLAKLIGGNYDDLNDISKKIFRSDAVFELIHFDTDFENYLKHNKY